MASLFARGQSLVLELAFGWVFVSEYEWVFGGE